jgi:hypothetical protein
MSAGVPALPFGLDPLIAEAKERARRRRLLALGVLVVAAVVIGVTFALRSPSRVNSLGVCASRPSGWKERTIDDPSVNPPAVVLTNFRFGRMDDFYGLSDRFAWPANGVTVAVANVGPSATPPVERSALRITAGGLGQLEGVLQRSGQVAVRSHGRILVAYVEMGSVTPATIGAANEVLAGVRVCST